MRIEKATLMHYDCRDNYDCGGSYVQIRDENKGQTIGQERSYCGRQTPPEFFSLGSRAGIKIQMDSTAKMTGSPEFRATFKAERCNRIHSEPNGVILSPGYPYQYPMDVNCQININLEEIDRKISIFFVAFELEKSSNCASDWLKIDNGPKLCGNALPSPYFKNANAVRIEFVSNSALSGELKYFLVYLLLKSILLCAKVLKTRGIRKKSKRWTWKFHNGASTLYKNVEIKPRQNRCPFW